MSLKDILMEIFGTESVRAGAFWVVIVTICVMAILQRPLPSDLLMVTATIMGYYFGKGAGTNGGQSNGNSH